MTCIFTPPPVPPAQRAANQLVGLSQGGLQQLKATLARGQALLWSNPAATPDAIVAALGTQAAELFAVAAATQAFVNSCVAGTNTFTAPRAATLNPDGTVTLAPPSSGS